MEFLEAVYLVGFVIALCYEWNFGPLSADRCDSAVPGWACAVLWPLVWPVRLIADRMQPYCPEIDVGARMKEPQR